MNRSTELVAPRDDQPFTEENITWLEAHLGHHNPNSFIAPIDTRQVDPIRAKALRIIGNHSRAFFAQESNTKH